MSAREAELAAQLAECIRVVMRTFTINEQRFPAAEGRLKFNAMDFQTLGYVAAHPACSAADVARFLGVAPTTMQSALDRMETAGLIVRTRAAEDRRLVSVSLTREGRAVQAAIQRQDVANCITMLAALPAKDRQGFVRCLSLIAAALEENADA